MFYWDYVYSSKMQIAPYLLWVWSCIRCLVQLQNIEVAKIFSTAIHKHYTRNIDVFPQSANAKVFLKLYVRCYFFLLTVISIKNQTIFIANCSCHTSKKDNEKRTEIKISTFRSGRRNYADQPKAINSPIFTNDESSLVFLMSSKTTILHHEISQYFDVANDTQ